MRIHTYAAGSGAAVTHPDVDPRTRLREVAAVEEDEFVARVGDDVEIDVKLTVVEIFADEPGHVIVHHCKSVAVTVDYGGAHTVVHTHPGTRVRDVRAKAIKQLEIDAAGAADLVLRVPGASEDLPPAAPIGAWVAKGSCELTVDLVHLVRPQG